MTEWDVATGSVAVAAAAVAVLDAVAAAAVAVVDAVAIAPTVVAATVVAVVSALVVAVVVVVAAEYGPTLGYVDRVASHPVAEVY